MSFDVIFCMDKNRGIGKDNRLPWHIKSDLLFFKSMTIHKSVIMGRSTWGSLPSKFKPLPNRTNFVVSKKHGNGKEREGVFWFSNFDEAYNEALKFNQEIMMIGGCLLLKSVLDHIKIRYFYLTVLEDTFECDLFLPSFEYLFSTVEIIESGTDKKTGIKYTIKRFSKS